MPHDPTTWLDTELAELEARQLRRYLGERQLAQGAVIRVDGQELLNFGSNDYLGLANDACHMAVGAAIGAVGWGAGASPLVVGRGPEHAALERELADFEGTEAALLFSSGYAANVGAITALAGPGDAIFSDALNHASVIDGARLSRAEVFVYSHRDPEHLQSLLAQHRARARKALIVTDSLFSMDGVIAPLRELHALARDYDAGLMVDEAHALGVFGPNGRGLSAALGIEPDVIVGTLGKSFGLAGAFVAASEEVVTLVRNRARSFVYSTAPPPMLARAAIAALRLVREADHARVRLLEHASKLRSGLAQLGFEIPEGESQIIPVLIGENRRTMQLSAKLLERGVFVQGIRPPTVPAGTARLRLTPMATHQAEQIEQVIAAFASIVLKR